MGTRVQGCASVPLTGTEENIRGYFHESLWSSEHGWGRDVTRCRAGLRRGAGEPGMAVQQGRGSAGPEEKVESLTTARLGARGRVAARPRMGLPWKRVPPEDM